LFTANLIAAELGGGFVTTKAEWTDSVGQSWAAMYRQTDRSFAGMTAHLLTRIADLPGDCVFDIGCGAGELSLALARERSDALIVGVDVSPNLVAAASERGNQIANVEFGLGDASNWSRPGFEPDLLVSRHGVMFFDDPVAAFMHLRGLAADQANLVFSCFRTPEQNPWMAQLKAMLPPGDAPTPDPYAPGPFAFADPEYVESILSAAGWKGITFEPHDFAYIAGAGDDPVADATDFFTHIGPAASALRDLDHTAQQPVLAELRRWLESHSDDGMVRFPAGAWFFKACNG